VSSCQFLPSQSRPGLYFTLTSTGGLLLLFFFFFFFFFFYKGERIDRYVQTDDKSTQKANK
jgi:predicted PurR-regulated permease PerM